MVADLRPVLLRRLSKEAPARVVRAEAVSEGWPVAAVIEALEGEE